MRELDRVGGLATPSVFNNHFLDDHLRPVATRLSSEVSHQLDKLRSIEFSQLNHDAIPPQHFLLVAFDLLLVQPAGAQLVLHAL